MRRLDRTSESEDKYTLVRCRNFDTLQTGQANGEGLVLFKCRGQQNDRILALGGEAGSDPAIKECYCRRVADLRKHVPAGEFAELADKLKEKGFRVASWSDDESVTLFKFVSRNFLLPRYQFLCFFIGFKVSMLFVFRTTFSFRV